MRARAVSAELRGQPCLGQPAGGHRFRRRSSLARPGARSPPGPAPRTHSRAQSWRPAPGGSPRRGRGPGVGGQGRGPRGAEAAGLSAGEGRRGGWRGLEEHCGRKLRSRARPGPGSDSEDSRCPPCGSRSWRPKALRRMRPRRGQKVGTRVPGHHWGLVAAVGGGVDKGAKG